MVSLRLHEFYQKMHYSFQTSGEREDKISDRTVRDIVIKAINKRNKCF